MLNSKVEILNAELKKFHNPPAITYMDVHSLLSNQGQLDSIYTMDGLHLTGKGYKVWKEIIENTESGLFVTFNK